jgi:transmembrane sensor
VLVPQVPPAADPPLSARWTVRVAAMVLIALTAILWINSAMGWRSYSTGVGEQRQIALPDGSRVEMNTNSEISIHLTKSSRTIQLVRGEALFTVAHDPTRPFDVQVGQTVIRAIGTEFDVYRQSAGTRVTVIDGLVQVSTGDVVPPFPSKPNALSTDAPFAPDSAASHAQHSETAQLVAAGEAALISVSGEISHHSDVDTDKAAAWRRSRLVFENETLASIAAEFNRYNALKIRVEGEAADQHFSGTFDANKPLSVMQVLAADSALQVERMDNEIVIRARERAGMNPPQP